MTLQGVSYAMRAAADVARAGENLLGSMDRSRRWGGSAPILLGVVLGVAIGALVFRKEARKQVLEWAGLTSTPARSTNGATADPRAAGVTPEA
jgi:hypothetical protein